MGPLQLAIRVAGEQKSHQGETNNGNDHVKLYTSVVCLASATFALQHGGFVPSEWLAARGHFI